MGNSLRDSTRAEDAMFRQMGWFLLMLEAICLLKIIFMALPISYNRFFLFAFYYLPDIPYLFFLFLWMIFIYLSAGHDPDRVMKKHSLALVLLLVVLIICFAHPVVPASVSADNPVIRIIFKLYEPLYVLVGIVYLIHAVFVKKQYQEDKKEPFYLKLYVFFLPWLLGVLADIAPSAINQLLGKSVVMHPLDIRVFCAPAAYYFTYLCVKKKGADN